MIKLVLKVALPIYVFTHRDEIKDYLENKIEENLRRNITVVLDCHEIVKIRLNEKQLTGTQDLLMKQLENTTDELRKMKERSIWIRHDVREIKYNVKKAKTYIHELNGIGY